MLSRFSLFPLTITVSGCGLDARLDTRDFKGNKTLLADTVSLLDQLLTDAPIEAASSKFLVARLEEITAQAAVLEELLGKRKREEACAAGPAAAAAEEPLTPEVVSIIKTILYGEPAGPTRPCAARRAAECAPACALLSRQVTLSAQGVHQDERQDSGRQGYVF